MELVEVLWDIFIDVIRDFFFGLNHRLLNVVIHGMSGRVPSRNYGRHRSLVRLIGTALPLKPCKRTCSSAFYPEHKHDTPPRHEKHGDSEAWSREPNGNTPDVISSMKFSTAKGEDVGSHCFREVSAEQFAALEKQVLQLRAEIAKILTSQLVPTAQESGREGMMGENFRIMHSHRSLDSDHVFPTASTTDIPVPPPPPPPLPSFSVSSQPLIRSQSLSDQINQFSKSQLNGESRKHHNASPLPPNMGEVLKNLSAVKLRHVERSPGGTPVRRRPLSPPRNDPAALLTAALRRRFACMQPDESSPERAFLNKSNDEKRFENVDLLPHAVTSQDINKLGTMKV